MLPQENFENLGVNILNFGENFTVMPLTIGLYNFGTN